MSQPPKPTLKAATIAAHAGGALDHASGGVAQRERDDRRTVVVEA